MILEQLFIVTAVLSLAMTLLVLIGANIYDLHEVKNQRLIQLHPHSRQYRRRPLVSVLVMARDQETVIERCLSNLVSSAYRKLEIIVIDNASQDRTRTLTKRFQQTHPKKQLRLVARRNTLSGQQSTAALVKKYAHGELILQLDASQVLDKQALARVVQNFNLEPAIDAMIFNQRIRSAFTSTGLFQRYQELLRYRAKKLGNLLGSNYELSGHATMCRREMLTVRKGVKPRSYYASNALVYVDATSTFPALVRRQYRLQQFNLQSLLRAHGSLFRRQAGQSLVQAYLRVAFALGQAIMAVLIPILISYFIYMALSLHEPAFLILSWILLAVLLLFALWGDEHLKFTQKLTYTLLLPITYGLFYILSFVTVVAALRVVLPSRRLLRLA